MNEHEFEGAARSVAGKIQGAAGALTGDTTHEVTGKMREVAGNIQAKAGEALESARDLGASRPIGTMLVAGALGFVLGVLFARRD
jgi:uncharacterized protein YjbJ (UPF0337 family)